jgi:hypothetical protein
MNNKISGFVIVENFLGTLDLLLDFTVEHNLESGVRTEELTHMLSGLYPDLFRYIYD